MSSLTRGPLSAGVYWRRRLAVLATAVLLVVGLARILGGGSDGSSDDDGRASLADAPVSSGTTSEAPTAGPTTTTTSTPGTKPGKKPGKKNTPVAPTSTAPVLAAPDGPCVDSDVAVTPEVGEAIGGPDHGVVVSLEVRSITDEACTWKVSASSLAVKITSGTDDIWSSRECPRAITAQQLTVRRAVSATVTLTWNGRRSDEDCSRLTEWAMPGWYHVSASAIGGEPSEVQFELLAPQPGVVTETVDPQQDEDGKKDGKGTGTPSHTPSGAVEPDSTTEG